jgi:hypothetical protein
MENGDVVRVYPHGKEQHAVEATVIVVSKNERSIAVALGNIPPLWKSLGYTVHLEHGVVLVAYRQDVGPWIELFNGGHYEIEEL